LKSEAWNNSILGAVKSDVVLRTTFFAGTIRIKMQSDANTEMKSRVNCFSSLLNFNNNESTHIN